MYIYRFTCFDEYVFYTNASIAIFSPYSLFASINIRPFIVFGPAFLLLEGAAILFCLLFL